MNRLHLTLAVALGAAAVAAPLQAQTLFSTRGLGVPVAPVDARGAALGGIGLGLPGLHTSLMNPAELSGVTRRGVTAVLQPLVNDFEIDGVQDGTSSTRFPLLVLRYPISSRIVTAVGYGAYLDQSYAVVTESQRPVEDRMITVIDRLRSRGGISQLRLNGAYVLTPTLSVGAGVGVLTGRVQRSAERVFSDTSASLIPFDETLEWRFGAPVASIGARWLLGNYVVLSGSAMMGGDLKATAESDLALDRDYGAPLELASGASVRLAADLLLTGGAVWSRLPATTGDVLSRETLRVGGGAEYEGFRSGSRTFPLRLGGHWSQLPYYRQGEEPGTEWGISGGLGFRLGNPLDPGVVADFAVERGGRSGLGGGAITGLEEKLWRFTVSLSLFAN